MKTALMIGATGLVGKQLVKQLLNNPAFQQVKVFVRRTTGLTHAKLEEHLVNFDLPENWQHLVTGDVAFSCLGTTMKQAGSKEAQYLVDHTYQYQFATAAAANQVPVYVLISAAGAGAGSRIFYSRIKGELEDDVKALRFSSINILRPGLLAGNRSEERVGEKVGYHVLRLLNAIGLFRRYKPIKDETVAAAMISAALTAKPGIHSYTLDEVFTLAGPAGDGR